MRCRRLPRKCHRGQHSGWNCNERKLEGLKVRILIDLRGIIRQRQRRTLQRSVRMCRGRRAGVGRDRTLLVLLKNMIETHYVTGLVGHLLRH